MPARRSKGGQASAWTPGRSANQDAETAHILASYPPEVFQPDELDVVLGHGDQAAAEKKLGLELLARARIETVPVGFSASFLMAHIREWQPELKEWEIGPEPPAAEREALEAVISAANRLTLALNRLEDKINEAGSRIASSTFTAHWHHTRLDRLRHELDALRIIAKSPEVKETMRREDRPLKPGGGWSARVALYGDDMPKLYTRIFRRRFTVSNKTNITPTEGVRFACVIASEVLGYPVMPATVVKQKRNYQAAGGGKRGQK